MYLRAFVDLAEALKSESTWEYYLLILFGEKFNFDILELDVMDMHRYRVSHRECRIWNMKNL